MRSRQVRAVTSEPSVPRRLAAACRIGWTVLAILVLQTVVCGLAMLPAVAVWAVLLSWPAPASVRVVALSAVAVPTYVIFALMLMLVSGLSVRILRMGTPEAAEMRIADAGWPLLAWVRYMSAIHVVRLFAGTLLRGTPVWTAYLRLAGARVGPRVYVNSLAVSDYNLLEFGEGVIIGADVHISGHTVERGVVRTGRVRLGSHVTVGIGSVVDIDTEVADGCQIGAFAFVPKHSRLEVPGTYVGIPAYRLEVPAAT